MRVSKPKWKSSDCKIVKKQPKQGGSFTICCERKFKLKLNIVYKTSQELRMLSSVTLNYQVTKSVMNIQVLNCQHCNQCFKCHKSLGLSLSFSLFWLHPSEGKAFVWNKNVLVGWVSWGEFGWFGWIGQIGWFGVIWCELGYLGELGELGWVGVIWVSWVS